jgi:6-pyruvoyl-tetrahydropterin synthase
MYAVEVRDHIMIAHSLPGDVFGPAQRLHGATFVVDVTFMRSTVGVDNIVVDIGRALQALRDTLQPLNYANLDDNSLFAGKKTTAEFMAREIFERIAKAIMDGQLGPEALGIERMRVTLNESHVARAWYEAALGA